MIVTNAYCSTGTEVTIFYKKASALPQSFIAKTSQARKRNISRHKKFAYRYKFAFLLHNIVAFILYRNCEKIRI